MALAFWISRSATESELVNNYYIMVEKAYIGPLIIAGILGATFSSALALLWVLRVSYLPWESNNILPFSEFLSGTSKMASPEMPCWLPESLFLLRCYYGI